MSEIRANTVSNAAGTGPATLTGQYAAKAWVNFNGVGTPSIRESGNVSSITDNGTGDYSVNFATAMPDANYSAALLANMNSAAAPATATERSTSRTSSLHRFYTSNATTTLLDSSITSATYTR